MPALTNPVSLVKATQHYFTEEPHGRKISMDEFKALTDNDKTDFATMLRAEGYTIEPDARKDGAPRW